MKKIVSHFLMALGMIGLMSLPAQAADDYPSKPINMIIAFTAGGSSDVQARIMQKYWNKYNPNTPWVFIYKPGAGGMIGFTEIARAKTATPSAVRTCLTWCCSPWLSRRSSMMKASPTSARW